MHKILKLVFAAFILILTAAGNASAQTVTRTPKPGSTGTWQLLGSTQASHSADHDVILIKGPFDYFRKLKFKVTNSPLNLQRMLVRYDDGGLPESIPVNSTVPKGGESRAIDLKGGKRKLKSVEYWYDTKGILNGRANMTLFGLR
jgi:hypothetical protein